MTGLADTYPGEGLGCEPDAAAPALEPVLRYRVLLPEGCDVHTALRQLRELEQEDPLLHVVWDERLGEVHLQLMGEVQLEILQSLLERRFGLEVAFDEGGILYKETIDARVEGVGHYEPLRHYAEVHLLLEPGEPGSGIQLATACREDDLAAQLAAADPHPPGREDPPGPPDRRAADRCEDHPGRRPGPPQAHRGRRFPPGHLPCGAAGPAHRPGGGRLCAAGALVRVHDCACPRRLWAAPWPTCPGSAPSLRRRSLGRGDGGAHGQGAGVGTAGLRPGGGGLHPGPWPADLPALAATLACHNAEEVIAAAGYDAGRRHRQHRRTRYSAATGRAYNVRWDEVAQPYAPA